MSKHVTKYNPWKLYDQVIINPAIPLCDKRDFRGAVRRGFAFGLDDQGNMRDFQRDRIVGVIIEIKMQEAPAHHRGIYIRVLFANRTEDIDDRLFIFSTTELLKSPKKFNKHMDRDARRFDLARYLL